jgi:hypothetical protein
MVRVKVKITGIQKQLNYVPAVNTLLGQYIDGGDEILIRINLKLWTISSLL